jgi:hypothetical protein
MDYTWWLLWVCLPVGGLYYLFTVNYCGFLLMQKVYQESKWLRHEDGKKVPQVAVFKFGQKIETKKMFQTTLDWHKQAGPTYQVFPFSFVNIRCGF